MESRDRMAIESLFAKLADVERADQPRDPEAEAYIRQRIADQPSAPYYMAQTIVVQQQALDAAQSRIAELESSTGEEARGPFGGLFGNDRPQPSSRTPSIGARRGARDMSEPGGFLAGAAQTAMGVAGGVLLANMIASAVSGNEAQAAEQPAPQEPADRADQTDPDDGMDEADFDDDGIDGGAFDLFGDL